jgi:hypothetical protein
MYVKSLVLTSIKGFKSLSFDFERPRGKYAGWTVFVGGNSSGKSTVLKSIAIALMGPEASRELLGYASTWRGWMHNDERRSEIQLVLTWDSAVDRFRKTGANPMSTFEAGMRFSYDTSDEAVHSPLPTLRPIYRTTQTRTKILTHERGPWAANAPGWFSAGYGPMRRLTGSSPDSVRLSMGQGSVSRYFTLFREDAALAESETWLKTNHARWLEEKDENLKSFLDFINELLGDGLLPSGMAISRVTVDNVYVKDSRGIELPMRDISDGCRGVYATVLDLVHSMSAVYGTRDLLSRDETGKVRITKPGVVLIDEIEAHLHPSWQRDIPEWFKSHFPHVQFFVTTHSPLIAQAADVNGAFLLPSTGDVDSRPRPLTEDELEKLRLGRAEKTLLGVAFGLRTSRSAWAISQIAKWKRLNAKKQAGVALTQPELVEFECLHNQMDITFESDIQAIS